MNLLVYDFRNGTATDDEQNEEVTSKHHKPFRLLSALVALSSARPEAGYSYSPPSTSYGAPSGGGGGFGSSGGGGFSGVGESTSAAVYHTNTSSAKASAKLTIVGVSSCSFRFTNASMPSISLSSRSTKGCMMSWNRSLLRVFLLSTLMINSLYNDSIELFSDLESVAILTINSRDDNKLDKNVEENLNRWSEDAWRTSASITNNKNKYKFSFTLTLVRSFVYSGILLCSVICTKILDIIFAFKSRCLNSLLDSEINSGSSHKATCSHTKSNRFSNTSSGSTAETSLALIECLVLKQLHEVFTKRLDNIEFLYFG
ncbi:hypothetical protein HUJ04_000490 [Dendroctonus ponderosae]|nr:hypothetical protein HUJ04_000490 [Dendroctonus ponderosae]